MERLPGTNTLAYYKNLYLTAVKSFITLTPDGSGRSGRLCAETVKIIEKLSNVGKVVDGMAPRHSALWHST